MSQKKELPDMVKMSNPLPKPELLSTEPFEQLELVGDNLQYSVENMKEIILLVLPHIRSLSALLSKIAAKVSTLSEEFERIVRQFDIRYPVDVVKLFTNDEFLEAVFSNEEAKQMLIGKLNKKLPVQIDVNKQKEQQKQLESKKQSGGRQRRRKGKKSVKKNNAK